ncbi:hypothetical protein [Campylobacter geochelonis]|uniref:hypothetical protein n=1 Tax=Campylobacter geochelonis TaxID=1780362 RepID=UPI000770A9CE|nr:hypothetical protein [Campylobacter geochelonis]CZE51088.1 putative formate C-acetyltransferase [Campylobacter geochelonis]
MAGFEKGKWKAQKLSDFKRIIKNSPLGRSEKTLNEIESWYSSILDDVVKVKEIKTKEDAEKELKNQKNQKAFFAITGIVSYIFDTVDNVVKFHKLPIDTSGSSIDDGNDKLYLHVEKSEIKSIHA